MTTFGADGFSLKKRRERSTYPRRLPGLALCWLALALSFWLSANNTSASCISAPAGLVSWWRGEGNAIDAVSTNNGTLSAGAGFATGEVGRAFSFDGASEVAVPSTPALNVTTFTFEAWVNPSALDGNMEIILNKENSPAFNESDVSYEMAIRGNADPGSGSIPVGNLAFFIGGISGLPGEYGSWVGGAGAVPINQWTHCALTFNGTTLRVYINGNLTRTFDGLSGTVIATTGPFKIGSRSALQVNAAPASRFNGLIDEVRVYGRALSTNEVAAIYAAGSAGMCPPVTQTNCVPAVSGLVGWWAGENSTADQVSGNNGTVAGTGTVSYGPGEVRQGFVFDGTHRDRVNVGNPVNLRLEDFTIEAWVKRSSASVTSFDVLGADGSVAGDGACIFGYGRGGYIFAMANDGRLILSRTDLDGLFSAPLVADTNWHHLAVTKSGSLAAFYVDGVPQSTPAYDHPAPYSFDDTTCACTAAAAIGSRGDGRGGTFFGTIDEVAVYNRPLSPTEIQAIYNASSAGKCPTLLTNCVPAPPGLLSWWKAESSTMDRADGNNGIFVGNATFGAGQVGQGFLFDGNGDAVLVGNSANLQRQDFTIEAWVKRASSSTVSFGSFGNGVIFGFGQGGYGLYLGPDGRPALSKIGISETTPATTITDTNFHHLAVTKSGSTVLFYIDGVGYSAPAYDPGFEFTTIAAIGARGDNLDNSFLGTIDEASVYSRVLSAAEIQSIYNAGSAGKCGSGCLAPPTGLVSWWRAESNAMDSIDSNHGALVNGASVAPGRVGHAFSFDGVDDFVSVDDAPNLRFGPTSPMTVEMWVFRTSSHPAQHMIGKRAGCTGSSTEGTFQLFLNYPAEGLGFGNPGGSCACSGQDLPLNTWTHLAGTFDGTTLRLFINGQVVATTPGSLGPANTAPLKIGDSGSCGASYGAAFGGLIDEVSLYNRALSTNEIDAIFAAGSAGKCPPTSPTNCIPAPSGLVSWWRAENGPQDSVDGNHGSLIGNVTYAPGRVGQAFNLDGANSYINIPSSSSIDFSGNMPMTIETWVYRTGASSTMHFFGKRNRCYLGEIQYQMALDPENGISFTANGNAFLLRTFRQLPMNTWQHLAVTYDGATAIIFINGQAVASGSGSLGPALAAPLEIGNSGSCGSDYSAAFAGLIDELSIYNRALSTNEIQAIYTAGSGGKCGSGTCVTPPPSLVSWWRGEHNTLDQIGNNNGTLVGNATYAPGLVGEGFSFDGQGGYVSAGSSDSLRFTNQLSLSAWIFPTGPGQHPQYGGIIVNREGEYELARFADGTIGWAFANQGSVWTWLSSGAMAPLNQWTYVALTFNNGLASAFVNGQLVQSNSGGQLIGDVSPTLNEFRIGNRQEGGQAFAGLIDEVTIFSRALSTNEVSAIYAAGNAGMCPPPSQTNCVPAPSGLISWWKADNSTMDSADGNNGIFAGNATFGAGQVGQGFLFDGNGDAVLVGNSANLQRQDFTIEAWVKRASSSTVSFGSFGNGVIFGFGQGGYGLYLGPDGRPALSKIGINETTPATTITDTNFHHLAVTKSGGTVLFYIDGVAYSAPAYDPGFEFTTIAAIGARGDNLDNSFLGTIDEVSVYSRVLSAVEIQSIYNAGSAGKCASSIPPQPVLASITSQPTNVTVYVGSNATFRVTATGTAPLSYQWLFNGNDLPGKTSSVLSLSNVQFSNAGPYSVVISNAAGSITSSNATLVVRPLPECVPPPAGLVGWWRADNNVNDNWDSNNGLSTRILITPLGKVGSAFSFGTGLYVSINDAPSLRFTNAFTVEAWVNPSTVSGTAPRVIISKFDNPLGTPVGMQSAYLLGITNSGRLFLTVSGTGSARTNTTLVTTQALPVNQWTFVVGTYDGSALRLYINGALSTQTNYSGGIFPGTANLSFGGISFGSSFDSFVWPFSGLVDEVSLYNRALNESEIQGIFNSDVIGKCLVPPSIAVQPQDQTIPLGEDVKFTVSVVGSRPLKYQWRFNGANLANATNSTLVLERLQTNSAGNYSVFVSNAVGFTISSNAALSLLPAPTCTDTPAGLISWWPADGNTTDAMGTNNISVFSPSLYATGKVGQAFGFNGISSRIQVTPATSLNFGSNADFSIEMWIKAGASNTIYPNVPLLEKRYGSAASWVGYSLALNQGRLALSLASAPFSPTNVSTFIADGPDLRDLMFHHVAATVNRTSIEGGHLYVDGQMVLVFDPTARKGSLTPGAVPAAVPVYLGAPSITFSNSYFGGLIDEPAIYDRALAATEILAIRQAGAAGRCKAKPSITTQPISQRLTIGSNVTFTVEAIGTPLLRYQWFSSGQSIPGATSSSYGTVVQNSLTLSVRVTNVFGSIVSSNTILIANHVPTGSAHTISLNEDTPTPITLIANDPDGDLLTYVVAAPPTNGSVTGAAPDLVYTPKPNFFGSDSFDFKVNDGLVDSEFVTVSITVMPVNDPPVPDASATKSLVLSPNGTNATVVLDGSLSSDVDSETLQYSWFLVAGSNQPLATGIVAIVVLPVGTNLISLQVSDGAATATNLFTVEVITTGQAVERLVAAVNSDISRSAPLIATLRAAIASIDRSNPTAAINQLQAFQNQVRAQVEPLDAEAAQTLFQSAQEVIDELSTGSPGLPGGGRPQVRIETVIRQSNGKFRLKFLTPPGTAHVVAASTDMVEWRLIGVAVDRGDGTFEFEDASADRFDRRFYRIISP